MLWLVCVSVYACACVSVCVSVYMNLLVCVCLVYLHVKGYESQLFHGVSVLR